AAAAPGAARVASWLRHDGHVTLRPARRDLKLVRRSRQYPVLTILHAQAVRVEPVRHRQPGLVLAVPLHVRGREALAAEAADDLAGLVDDLECPVIGVGLRVRHEPDLGRGLLARRRERLGLGLRAREERGEALGDAAAGVT